MFSSVSCFPYPYPYPYLKEGEGARALHYATRRALPTGTIQTAPCRRSPRDENGEIPGEGIGGRGRNGRLRAVADAYGRSYGAVRNRAIRIGASSR